MDELGAKSDVYETTIALYYQAVDVVQRRPTLTLPLMHTTETSLIDYSSDRSGPA